MHYLAEDYPKFPPVSDADEDGLLAVNGNLYVDTLKRAYQQGIFPWFNDDTPILWWSPDPRLILRPVDFRLSKSMCKVLRKKAWKVTINNSFEKVITACSRPSDHEGRWITSTMCEAYISMHNNGLAHSFEVWDEENLVGGLYGIAVGKIFFGESMFSHVSDASKTALFYLTQYLKLHAFPMIDCQVYSKHLASLGAELIPRSQFVQILENECNATVEQGIWKKRVISDMFLP